MRILIVVLCVVGAACADGAVMSPVAPSASLIQGSDGIRQTSARNGSLLPFKGDLQATETVDGSLHHLAGSGNGSRLGRFTYTAEITVDDATGNGTGTVVWTAANGDTISATTAGTIIDFTDSGITIRETQAISGGSGRFAGASGTIVVTRTLDFATGYTSGTYSGTVNQVS